MMGPGYGQGMMGQGYGPGYGMMGRGMMGGMSVRTQRYVGQSRQCYFRRDQPVAQHRA